MAVVQKQPGPQNRQGFRHSDGRHHGKERKERSVFSGLLANSLLYSSLAFSQIFLARATLKGTKKVAVSFKKFFFSEQVRGEIESGKCAVYISDSFPVDKAPRCLFGSSPLVTLTHVYVYISDSFPVDKAPRCLFGSSPTVTLTHVSDTRI